MLDKIVINNGVKIQYKVKEGIADALIFLHGGGGSQTAWEIMLPLFKDIDRTIITVDLRGHGLSDRPAEVNDYTLEKHAQDILSILKQERLNKVVLVGHCLGSMVAATFAALYPERVEKLVLVNTNYELPWFISRTPIRQCLYLILSLVKYLFPYKAVSVQGVDYAQFVGSSEFNFGRLSKDLMVMGTYSVIRQSLALLAWRGTKYFTTITALTLVLSGKHDLLYPKGTGERVVELISKAKLEYVDSNHISIINNPKEVYDRILEFLQTT